MSSPQDCDIYARLERIPTVVYWDYANVTTRNESTIAIINPQYGNWYLGIYGFAACSFTATVSTGATCPNDCSHRGTCTGNNGCSCPAGYSGDYCQTRNAPLQNGDTDTGYVKYNAWNYYTYTTDSADNFDISIFQTSSSPSSDCDLYVRAGALPNRFTYDYQDIYTTQNTTLSIEDPGAQTWYIGVFGWSECSYTILTIESGSCPVANCNGHGTCNVDAAVCVCNPGWTGEACEFPVANLFSSTPVNASVQYNGWNYYNFNVDQSSALYIVMKEKSTSGELWLYVAKTFPTIRQYLYSDTQTNTNVHIIAIENDVSETTTYQIGVYSNPFSLPSQTISYSIVAWSPNL